jgi:hypothetical protein
MNLKDIEMEVARLSGSTSQISENLKAANDRMGSFAEGESRLFKVTVVFLTAIIGVLGLGATLAAYIQFTNNDKFSAASDAVKKQFEEIRSELKTDISASLKQNRSEIDKFIGVNTLALKDIRSSIGDPDVLSVEARAEPPEGSSKNYRYILTFYYEVFFEGEGSSKVLGTRNYYDGPFLDVIDNKEIHDSFVQRLRQGMSIVQNDASVTELLPASMNATVTVVRKSCEAIAKIDAELRALPSLGSIKVIPSFEKVARFPQGRTLKLVFDKKVPPVDCKKRG